MATSYNGYPASTDKAAIGVKDFKVAGRSFPGGVKAGDVATVLRYVVAQHHLRVRPVGADSDEWGYAYRNVRSGSRLSNHSSGTAVDVDAAEHPLGKAGTYTAAEVARIHRIVNTECKGLVTWGGDWSRPDEMHYEIKNYADRAKLAALAKALVSPAWFKRTLTVGMEGADVKRVQARLGVKADGVFGPVTCDAVRRMEARLALPVTGKVDKSRAFYVG